MARTPTSGKNVATRVDTGVRRTAILKISPLNRAATIPTIPAINAVETAKAARNSARTAVLFSALTIVRVRSCDRGSTEF